MRRPGWGKLTSHLIPLAELYSPDSTARGHNFIESLRFISQSSSPHFNCCSWMKHHHSLTYMFSLSLVSKEDVRPWPRTKPSCSFPAPWCTDFIASLQSQCQERLMVQSSPIHELQLHQAWKNIPTLFYLFKPVNYLIERADWSLQFLWAHQRSRTQLSHVYWLGSFFFSFFQSPNFLDAWLPTRTPSFLWELGNFGEKIHTHTHTHIYIHTHIHVYISSNYVEKEAL